MAMQLWFLRHGEAEPHDVRDDFDRRLTPRGEEQSRAAGRAFKALAIEFQLVFSSPRVRALDTARLTIAEMGDGEILIDGRIGGGFDVDDALELAGAAGDDKRILFVGHNPDFPQIIHDLSGGFVDMKKGGVAAVRMQTSRRGEIVVVMRPRELARIS